MKTIILLASLFLFSCAAAELGPPEADDQQESFSAALSDVSSQTCVADIDPCGVWVRDTEWDAYQAAVVLKQPADVVQFTMAGHSSCSDLILMAEQHWPGKSHVRYVKQGFFAK